MIPESAWEADKLQSVQLEFDTAKELCDECFKEILPNTFNNEPCLKYFGVNVSDTWIRGQEVLVRQMMEQKGSVDGFKYHIRFWSLKKVHVLQEHESLIYSKLMATNSVEF